MIINTIRSGFDFFIGLGGAAMMFFIITLLSLAFKVKFSKAVEGGLRMAVALTGMSAVISLLTTSFGPALDAFVKSTGVSLNITDLGWAPLAVITWGSVYTLYFAFLAIITNLVMLFFKLTNTLNVDLFNIWNVSILGLLIHHYSGGNLFVTSLFVVVIIMLMLFNADAIKPTINELLGYDDENITTTAHPSLLVMPLAMLLNRLIDKCIPFIDKFDFDADTLNKKIGFWGSKFAIGAYLGVFIGLLGKQSVANILTLAFTAGVALELFAYVGGWFGPAIEPLSGGIQTMMSSKLRGRKLYVAIDWPILASRAEIWAVANILAPIMLIIAMFLPGNRVLPLGGIILTVLTPALLLVTKGRVIRMTLIGTIMVPIFLWAATLIAPFITSASIAMNNFPKGLAKGQLFSSIDSDPIEKMLAILFGRAFNTFDLKLILSSLVAIIGYGVLFKWYLGQMHKDALAEADTTGMNVTAESAR
ncbi:PTS transporter subunit IIC [Schleiferilactobacillus perolens]|jgi:PTS system galactitol-specific IIC component|uniref:Galactitol PTS n=1 Tax=Schleiferilactobacillus perolens DSM 12744 TaxID=1423792 RepID=A0A0R1NC02_9LACO|nr:PTS transporter subunit IIC [Schleiferilactobacillus perolens]KRL14515.1 galactitol PTS [Schleiferilactobacillus perolens DSM 12744]